MTNKQAQRKICRDRRLALTKEERMSFSAAIADKLLAEPLYISSHRLFIYRSTEEEADTSRVIAEALRVGKEVYLPRIEGENMVLVRYAEGTAMSVDEYGIEEPAGAPYTGEIDLAVIPLVGFDRARRRLGRGKGYYDRFLAGYKGMSVALAFSVQELPEIEAEAHDAKPSLIITERGRI